MEIRREGRALIVKVPSMDPLCLRCSCILDDDAIPYCYSLGLENYMEYRLCWHCAPGEWQAEVIAFEATIAEEDRLLS
jgi:hypothetical protein